MVCILADSKVFFNPLLFLDSHVKCNAFDVVFGFSSNLLPATPVSPANSRKLGDKLKGLKLQTSEKDLAVNNGIQSFLQSTPFLG
jgi:hypothetical protein